MKKKSTSQSAPARRSLGEGGFFNLRLFIGLFIVLAGVFLALVGFGTLASITANSTQAQQKKTKILNIQGLPPGFDCSKIHELGIDKMEGMRAGLIMIACGEAQGGSGSRGSAFSRLIQSLQAPLAYGAADVDLITGTETPPHITQSETYSETNPDNPNEIGVGFNDSRCASATNYSGASFSTDGGLTFTRLTNSSGCSPFANTFGDPVMLYNRQTTTWYAIWIDGNAGCTLGGYKSTTPTDPNSWTHFCVHSGLSDDRESGVVDNNSSSPFFGRMYVSWNDFGQSEQIRSTFSTDGGATWSAPVNVTNTFIRDVQITVDKITGDVYIAGMDENSGNGCTTGCGTNRNNKIFRSTDGGVTWTNTYTGPSFVGPCRSSSGYFCDMYSNPAYWRHMGWGQVGAYNHVVHYDYAAHGSGNDPGDVFYIRSTDSGVTFSAPFQLNSNTDPTKAQWEPNLSVSDAGTVFATWYDETPRVAASCQPSSPSTPCYQMHSRKSNDNGVTWLSDDTLSDVASPLPLQPDFNIVTDYVGDYDYGSAILVNHRTSWVDGRVIIGGASQQDAFTDRELVGFSVTSTNPACNSFTTTQPTDFTVNLSDAAAPSTVQASDFTVNGIPANTANLSNGNKTIDFIFNTSPVTTPGPQTMHIPAGAIQRISDHMGIFEFLCTFCYDTAQLQVTTTNPPVGGTFSPPAPGDYTYDVNFNQAVDPASVDTSDLTLTGNAGGTVTAVSVINGNMTAEFTVHFAFGGSVTANIGAGAITAHTCNGNAAFTGNYSVEGCPPGQYVITPGTDTIVPGTTDTGNHCDDCDTMISLPFTFQLYDQTYNAVSVDSNGRLDFVCQNEPVGFITACLPPPANQCPYDFTIFGAWEDMRTDFGLSGCSGFPGGNCGIFTSITGSPPNRIFNIEWRSVLYGNNASRENFEVRLYEGDPNLKFEVIYGTLNTNGATQTWVGGVQGNSGAGFFTQDFCGTTPPQNVSRTYEIPACFVLTGRGKVVGGINTSRLTWTGSTASSIDVFRNSTLIATVPNSGTYTDSTGTTGRQRFTYKVCDQGTSTCSNVVTVRFR